jgi:hypothetical protein
MTEKLSARALPGLKQSHARGNFSSATRPFILLSSQSASWFLLTRSQPCFATLMADKSDSWVFPGFQYWIETVHERIE